MKIKKGDNVMVICGKDRGKKGLVIQSLPKIGKVVVTGLNLAKKHLKPSKKNPHGGIINQPLPIDVSNILVVCPHCSRPVRVSYKIPPAGGGGKERVCRKCGVSLSAASAEKKS